MFISLGVWFVSLDGFNSFSWLICIYFRLFLMFFDGMGIIDERCV